MDTSKHTATPWKDNGNEIVDARGVVVGGALTDADGEFIVRACNAHDQLVAALAEALKVIDDYLDYEHNGDPWTEDARAMGEMDIDDYRRDGRMESARAALAAAGAA